MARRGRGQTSRKFVWARQDGVLTPGTNFSEDLLFQFKQRAGADGILLGSTVVAVKGYIRPNQAAGSPDVTKGRVGIRVCDEAEVEGDPPGFGPVAQGSEYDWMGFFPFFIDLLPPTTSVNRGDASWNHAASQWGVDVQSNRKMEELGQTLGIFLGMISANETLVAVDYDLSIGIKLP